MRSAASFQDFPSNSATITAPRRANARRTVGFSRDRVSSTVLASACTGDTPAVSDHYRAALPRARLFRRMCEFADDPKNFRPGVDPVEFVSHRRRLPAIGRTIERGSSGAAVHHSRRNQLSSRGSY